MTGIFPAPQFDSRTVLSLVHVSNQQEKDEHGYGNEFLCPTNTAV